VSKTITSPVMRYHGAKFRLADWVISFFPEHECYVEPFGGAAGVLMQKERSYAEVYNDLDNEIVNVFEVLRNKELSQRLEELCFLTPYHRDEFIKSYEPNDDPVEQARRTLFRASAGFGSGGSSGHNTGFRTDSKRAYSLSSHVWAKYPANIKRFGERLQGVIIENRPAIDVIINNDSPGTLFFIDPPYVMDTRQVKKGGVYKHEMTDEQHIQLLETLLNVEGYVVLTGYENPIYTEMLSSWDCHKKKARISAGRGTGIRVEQAWLNPKCAEKLSQPQLFQSYSEVN